MLPAGSQWRGAAVVAAAHLAEQRPSAVAGRLQVAAHRLQRGRPEVAGVFGAELIGLRGADGCGTPVRGR